MSFYPAMPPDVILSDAEDAALGLLGQAGVVAVRVADLACPARQGLGRDGRTALAVAGAGRIRSGDLVVWLKPVAVAPAVVRRDGRVQAAGHPADHARLGVAEQRLDELCEVPGVIDQVARSAVLDGRVKGAARRAMTPALAIRFTLLMTLTPDAGYPEVLGILLGDLTLVPWQRPYRVPTAAVACTWREALGLEPLERLRDLALAGVDGEHRSYDYRAVTAGDLEVGSIDGSLIRVPDTPANRAAFGSAGTADDSSPFPQLRELRICAASTRATVGVTTGPSGAGGARDKGEAEQVLLDKALKDHWQVFTPGRLWVMDRNFPGVSRIKAMLETGTHVLIRVRDGITLRRDGDFLRRVVPGGDLRRRHHDGRPGDRVHRHRRRPGRPGAVLPDHRPARPPGPPGTHPGQGVSLAVDRFGNLPERGQAGDQRRRAVHRADAPFAVARAGRSGTRRLGDRRRAGPRHCPRRRGDRLTGTQGTPRRAASPPSRDLVHRRPPGPHRLRPLRRSDRQPARRPDRGEPRRNPCRPGPPPRPGRPAPAPRPQNQGPAGLPGRRAVPGHPHRACPDQHLPALDRLTLPTPAGS
jgi:hypothetical protein